MRRTLTLLILGGASLVAGTALAGDHCDRPMRDWRPREAVEESARKIGVEVHRIRTDDGCYKIYGRTADGRSIEIEMDPVTLKVLETKYRDPARREDHHGRHGDDLAPSSATRPPQANPLIGPATGVTK